jgi:hypothetical protein
MSDGKPPSTRLRGPYKSNIDHIHDELARIDLLIRAQVLRWLLSTGSQTTEHDWGMVIVSETEVDAYLQSPLRPPGTPSDNVRNTVAPWHKAAERMREEIDDHLGRTKPDAAMRLPKLVHAFELGNAERDVLLLCLIGEIDERFRRVFGYLQNDASRQFLQVELAAHILEPSIGSVERARELFSGAGKLVRNRFIHVTSESPNDSVPVRAVRIDERTASFLLGSDEIDPNLAGFASIERNISGPSLHGNPEVLAAIGRLPAAIKQSLTEDAAVRIVLSGPDPRFAHDVARATAANLNRPLLDFQVRKALEPGSSIGLLTTALREARLQESTILFSGCDALLAAEPDRKKWDTLREAIAGFPGVVFLELNTAAAGPANITDAAMWSVELPFPDYGTRRAMWLAELQPTALPAETRERLAADLANAFQTTHSQIQDAVLGARNAARRDGLGGPTPDHVYESCRREAAKQLVSFAQRIAPRPNVSIANIVLPPANHRQLLDLENRIRLHRELMHETGFERSMRLGKGILALFAGPSGTGKTMAAEALARGQGVDLYKVDLSAVVSKYIGETEKNLDRIFSDAEASNGWLFFDEGESLFGSRGAVNQAQDRYLNLEVNYLLQRVEEFSGVVILATNLRQNIDDAFLRRIQVVVEFPQPGPDSRFAIWAGLLAGIGKRDFSDADLRGIAARFDVSGGNIRNIVLDAMYRAWATEDKVLRMRHLIAALTREYQKLNRPVTEASFGDTFHAWAVEDILSPAPPFLEKTG